MSVSQLHVTQLHAVDMCHARTDARTATALSQAREWGAQDLVALMMIVLFIVLARNKLRIPLEGTYSREM